MESEFTIYSRFIRHLKNCGGCVGPRNPNRCRFALVCAVIETSAKKGEITHSEDLLNTSANNRDNELVPNPEIGDRSPVVTNTADIQSVDILN